MTPQRAQELEAELRRLSVEKAVFSKADKCKELSWLEAGESVGLQSAADIVRDAAKEG